MATITSASAIFVLAIPSVFPNGINLQGFSADDAFDTAAVDASVTQVGVDGTGVAGWIPREVDQTISLLASSASNAVFDQWVQAQDALSDIIYASGSIRIPAIQVQYTMAMGALKRYPIAPNARRVLAPRQFVISWLPQPGIPAITSAPM